MMKSFFKKLASVLALAMVVSLAAPAAQTAAAAEAKEFTYKYQTGIGADVKTVNLAKTGDTVDLKFVGIPDFNNYETQWMSYGTGFTLDQSGVITATADAGEGVVWLSVGDDQTYVSDPIKVTIGEYTATIGTQDKSNKALEGATIKVGETMDLAFYGILDWNLGKYGYKWVVGDTSVLDVDQKTGEITGLKAGETTVTFLAPNKFNQANVVVTNALKVTVLPELEPAIEADQETENDFYLNFIDLTAANYDVDDLDMVRVFLADKDTNGDGVIDNQDRANEDKFFLKNATVDKDNNRLIVETYADFVDGATYEVRIGDDLKSTFVASVGEVKSIELSTTVAYIASDGRAAVPAELEVVLRDANGINVTDVEVKGIKNSENIVYALEGGDTNTYYLTGNEVTFVEPGYVNAYAYFDYYNITERLVSNVVSVRGTQADDWIAKVIAWDVVNEDASWVDGEFIYWDNVVANPGELWVAAGDNNRHVVALLEDSRGNYFSTHKWGTTSGTNNQVYYKGKKVYPIDYVDPTVGHSFVFAANGYYVEFETLNPDNLLMYEDGEVVTYKETKSGIKLNLCNIYNDTVEEIASVRLWVRPERTISYLSTNSTNIFGVTDTLNNAFDGTEGDVFDEDFWFTHPNVNIKVYDQYETLWWNAESCDFEVTLADGVGKYTSAEAEALNQYAEDVEARIDSWNSVDFWLAFNTKAIRQYLTDDDTTENNKSNRNAVSFKIEEKNSGRFVTIKVNLEVPNYTDEYNEDSEIKLDTEQYTTDADGNDTTTNDREKVTKLVNKLALDTTSIDQRATWHWCAASGWHWHYDWDVTASLYNTSKGYEVAYSADRLFVAKTLAANLTAEYDAAEDKYYYNDGTSYGRTEIKRGSQILVVVGPDNKIVNCTDLGVYDTASVNYDLKIANATSSALGVQVVEGTDDNGDTYYTYTLNTAALNTDEPENREHAMAYMKTGRYTVQVRTVASITKKYKDGQPYGKINLVTASADKTAGVRYFNITNTNAKIVFASQVTRDLREEADDIKEVIAKAFDFNYVDANTRDWIELLGNGNKADGREVLENKLIDSVDYRVGDGYVYIKSVTFRVPVDTDGNETWLPYYLCTVPVGTSVKISNDIFFYDGNAGNN